jgi:hypothetical protein
LIPDARERTGIIHRAGHLLDTAEELDQRLRLVLNAATEQ